MVAYDDRGYVRQVAADDWLEVAVVVEDAAAGVAQVVDVELAAVDVAPADVELAPSKTESF